MWCVRFRPRGRRRMRGPAASAGPPSKRHTGTDEENRRGGPGVPCSPPSIADSLCRRCIRLAFRGLFRAGRRQPGTRAREETLVNGLWAFVALAVALSLMPGPDDVLVLSCSLRGGPRSGAAAALGVAAGTLLWGVAAATGLAAIVEHSPVVYDGLRWAGAAYLVALGAVPLIAQGLARGDGRGGGPPPAAAPPPPRGAPPRAPAPGAGGGPPH